MKNVVVDMCSECGLRPSTCQCHDELDCADPHICEQCHEIERMDWYAEVAANEGYPEW